MKWSSEQEAIFAWFREGINPSLIVRARAGTGKTTTIKAAFTHAPERRILYAVFNKKNQVEAAREISDPRVEIKTLHSLGYAFIRQVWNRAKPDDTVENDRIDAAAALCEKQWADTLKLAHPEDDTIVPRETPFEVKSEARRLVGFAKNLCAGLPSLAELAEIAEERDIECPELEDAREGGYTQERLAQIALGALDLSRTRDETDRISFNDMVWLPVAMGWVRPWFQLVVVDEAQDMNLPQLLMARAACRQGGRICLVGDDRQAIYGFRGAASDGMQMMEDELGATRLSLTITYRCPRQVVALANELVPDYQAAESAPQGCVVHLSVDEVIPALQPGDALLSRLNAPLMPLCLWLLREGKPARIEGRDIGKMLGSIITKLKAKTVPHFLECLHEWQRQKLARLIDSKQREQKTAQINDQAATLAALADGASSVAEIQSRADRLFQDTTATSSAAIVLSTVHKAKGLEWQRVVLLSSTFKRKPFQDDHEEANIYYVALTRSKSQLVLAI